MSQQETVSQDSQNSQQNDTQGMKDAGAKHKMSIALTIGATIGFIGLILVLYGLFGGANYSNSDNININLWWGLLMLVFGVLMSGGNYLSTRRKIAH